MTKLNKVEGSKEKCPSCGKEIICRTKPASGNYPAKLQWQDPDGKAHYNYDFKTDTTTCRDETSSIPNERSPNAPESVVWSKISEDEKTEEMKQLVIGLKMMRALAYEDAKQVHPDMAENSNTFGQIVNAGMSHLINLAKIKAIKGAS